MSAYEITLSRRSLVTALVCTPIVSQAAASPTLPSPDAALKALGRQFNHLCQTWDELARRTNHTYEGVDIIGLIETLSPIEAAIVAARATTIEGLLVKAQAADWSRQGRIHPELEECTDRKMAWSIVRDLIELSPRADVPFASFRVT